MSQRVQHASFWRQLFASAALVLRPALLPLIAVGALAACQPKAGDAASVATQSASGAAPADAASAGESTTTAAPAASASTGSDFESRFAELHRTVYAEGTFFSGSQMTADLAALEPMLNGAAGTPDQRFRLYALQAIVFGRLDQADKAAALAQKALALALDWPPERHADKRFFLRISLPDWLQDEDNDAALAALLPLLGDYPLDQLDRLPLQADATSPSVLIVLGLHESHGYLLHELGRHREALSTNQRTLAAARQHLPANEQRRLQGVLTNIAQNHHALGQLSEAEPPLLERLKLMQAQKDDARILDSYFQLMVLAHERGQAKQADAWLARHEAHTKAMNDEDAQAESKRLRRELMQRRATGQ